LSVEVLVKLRLLTTVHTSTSIVALAVMIEAKSFLIAISSLNKLTTVFGCQYFISISELLTVY